MIELHGSEEAVRAYLSQSAKKSRGNTKGNGYWAQLKISDPDKLKEISKRAAQSRWGKREENSTKEKNAT